MSYISSLPVFNLVIGFVISLSVLFFPVSAYSQVKQTLPPEFSGLSITGRALSKEFEFTFDSNTIGTSQSFVLDKIGLILHLTPSPKIKDKNTKLRVFSSNGTEVKLYDFINGTLFALVSPDETYSIYEEIVPNCDALINTFNLSPSSTICPTSELFKLYERIMIVEDTSFKINLRNPIDSYLLGLTLPENTQLIEPENFTNVNILQSKVSDSGIGFTRPPVNIANLLTAGELCFVGRKKTANKLTVQSCSHIDSSVNSLISFKDSFTNLFTPSAMSNIAFSFLHDGFKNLSHSYIFEYSEDVKSEDAPAKVDKTSAQKLFFVNYGSKFNVNLGQVLTVAKKINKKNIFTLDSPIEVNKVLNDHSLAFTVDSLDPVITLTFEDNSFNVFLENLTLSGTENALSSFMILAKNNIIIDNLAEPEELNSSNQQLQVDSVDNLIISSYLPDALPKLTASTGYVFVEQFTAPSVDDNGKPIDVINNKSKADLIISKDFSNIDFKSQTGPFTIDIEKASNALNNKSFTKQGNLSGFLIPPDLRPVIQSGYRANVSFSMSINLINNETLEIIYSDLKTKDETALTNFFNFSYLPLGKYNVKLEFDADRSKFFEAAGITPITE